MGVSNPLDNLNKLFKKMKRILLVTASTIIIAHTALATEVIVSKAAEVVSNKKPVISDLEVKLTGYADFQAGLRHQNHLEGDEKNVSANRQNFAFYNASALVANISNEVNGVTYGGKFIAVPTSKRKGSPSYNGTNIYVESNFGRLEAGSPFSAAGTMAVDGSTIAVGTFDGWSDYANMAPAYLKKEGSKEDPSFTAFPEFFLDSKLTANLDDKKYTSEPPRSVAYYTPKFELAEFTKVQLGVSYTPDSTNTGADSANAKAVTTDVIVDKATGE